SFAAILLFLSGQRLAEASDDLRLDRQLLGRALERHLGDRTGHAVELEQDAARLDAGNPELGRALARAHADFGGLRRHGNVREHTDPQAPLALDVTCDRAASRLDLASGDPVGLHGLEAEGAEVELGPALGIAMDAALEGLAELGALGLQHVLLFLRAYRLPRSSRAGRTPEVWASIISRSWASGSWAKISPLKTHTFTPQTPYAVC